MQSKCNNCQVLLDFNENHPIILSKCGHIICNKCKTNSVTSEDGGSGFDNITCPVKDCGKKYAVKNDCVTKAEYRTKLGTYNFPGA